MKARRSHSGRIEPKKGLEAVDEAGRVWKAAYQSALKFDDMPEDTKFAVFSDNNPFVQFISLAFEEYNKRIQEYKAGGYVGLRL